MEDGRSVGWGGEEEEEVDGGEGDEDEDEDEVPGGEDIKGEGNEGVQHGWISALHAGT